MTKRTSPTFIRSTLSIALLTTMTAPFAYADEVVIEEKKDVSTPNVSATRSQIYALTPDGKLAGGWSYHPAFGHSDVIWSAENGYKPTTLAKLPVNHTNKSSIHALSADGKVAGGWVERESNDNRGFATIWSGNDYKTKTVLGSGANASQVFALSADGKVAGGGEGSEDYQAVIWSGGGWATRTRLGGLRTIGGGDGSVHALSADGKVAGGWVENDYDDKRAIIWHGNNWATKVDLGTLHSGNLGDSRVRVLSADGKVAGGDASTDEEAESHKNGNIMTHGNRAVIWSGENWATKTDLGTLLPDNSGSSSVYALSADGKIAGGLAASGILHATARAVIWSGENWATKTDLGTPREDNVGASGVTALSADGTVAGGWVDYSGGDGLPRATLWRLTYPTLASSTPATPLTAVAPTSPVAVAPSTTPTTTPSTTTTPVATPTTTPITSTPTPTTPTPAVVGKIDVANTTNTIAQLGKDSFTIMSMQSHALDRLRHTCHSDDGLCVGIQQDISFADGENHKRRDVAMGANVGYGFGNGLSVGVAIDHSANRKLPNSFKHDSDDVGVGAVVRYRATNGVFGEISYAKDDYTATITRPTLEGTELGVNQATIKGVGYGMKVGKSIGTSRANVRTSVGVKHTNISRDAYTENDGTAFPISYGKMTHKATHATAHVGASVDLTQNVAWVSDVEIAHRVSGDDPVYTASLTGVEKYDFAYKVSPAKTTGQIATGLRYKVSDSTYVEFMPYAKKHDDDTTGYGALFRIEGRFE